MLDTVTGDRINIADLNLEEPKIEPDSRFNPDRDIPRGLKTAFESKLSGSYADKDWHAFQRYAFEARVLFPEDLKPYSGLESDSFDEMKLIGIQVYLRQQNFQFSNYLAFVSRFKMALGLSDKAMVFFDGDRLWGMLAGPRVKDLTPQEHSDLLFYSRILLPKDKQLEDNLRVKNFLSAKLKKSAEEITEHSTHGSDRLRFLQDAFHFKVLFPGEDTSGFNNEKVWKKLKEYWKTDMNFTNLMGFAVAAYLALLDAEKIEMTASGLVVTPSKPPVKLTETIPALPEVRKF